MTKYLTLLLMLLVFSVQAQVVDTWVFSSQAQRQDAMAIAGELRCPQCQNQSLLESNSPVAVSMRHEVFSMVEQGKDKSEIMAFMNQRYGDFVQYNPPMKMQTGILWLTPGLLLLAIVAIAWRVMRRQNRGARS
ncbi:heme lyase NrfEFG subunit NrfF [Pectobacterium parmentieri]|uniref:Formate-dependent nitrite reductase complex subunit n=1 Tax=Pectobacterium parmentieri TaxID=1905730 RepID=A0A0H3I6G1_PECPM|nr:heme lyase NrfEFG subunit NrfF [Pectobacterium parmentieri]ACX88484.1 cytochrome c nitrite reductase, accessory protein NrfF [Pectobacterium parmentieri WPP163]AFI90795.1 Formate-dependent nitrite reductase complex, nrfF subunit [Pectobacterium parmentieri]AOR58259.1 heme lyase NrfEFG subunit NrfF [Pectobacterium parmentieri]AYH01910.1 heme lyase NrfEFG subunit NrfF [Pectobacterium parmentieri]AYH06173.1 heme lyase NrfEFG subunit NrfF [Pectobacterium parmentieri]